MPVKPNYIRPLDIRHGVVDMTFGAGGRATSQLIAEVFAPAFTNPYLDEGHDGAVLPAIKGQPVMSCDGHVVNPLIFPGGDIGRLAVSGTVNDGCGLRRKAPVPHGFLHYGGGAAPGNPQNHR